MHSMAVGGGATSTKEREIDDPAFTGNSIWAVGRQSERKTADAGFGRWTMKADAPHPSF